MRRKQIKRSNFAIPEKKKYPINTMKRARNAIARVQQHGSPSEKRRVFAAVRRKFPALARRSRVIPTRKGPGRRRGQRPRTRAGGSSVPGTVRRRRRKGVRRVATRRQRAAARKNIKKAQAALRRKRTGRRKTTARRRGGRKTAARRAPARRRGGARPRKATGRRTGR